jgi:hypothetical protein
MGPGAVKSGVVNVVKQQLNPILRRIRRRPYLAPAQQKRTRRHELVLVPEKEIRFIDHPIGSEVTLHGRPKTRCDDAPRDRPVVIQHHVEVRQRKALLNA